MNNKPFSVVSLWFNLLLVIAIAWGAALPQAYAGEWKLSGYFWDGKSHSELLVASNRGGPYETYVGGSDVIPRRQSWSYPPSSASITASGENRGQLPNYAVKHSGVANGNASIGSSVRAEFIWKRNQLYSPDPSTGISFPVDDPNDNPPDYVYVRETSSVSAGKSIGQPDGNATGYSESRPWFGDYFSITPGGGDTGLSLGEFLRYGWSSWGTVPTSTQKVQKVAVSGDKLIVPTHSFSGTLTLSPGYEKEIPDQRASASLSFGYNAEPVNFGLTTSVTAVAARKQTAKTEQIDALARLTWIYPEDMEQGADGKFHAKEDPRKNRAFWTTFSGADLDVAAPLPYFEGVATFNLTATDSSGHPLYSAPKVEWKPEGTDERFASPGGDPQVQATSDFQRTYAWNFGTASDGSVSFPKETEVSVKLTNNDSGEPLEAKANIHWYTVWTPTKTGLQKNEVIISNELVTRPDGSSAFANQIKPGDTLKAFVKGDPGFSTDSGRTESARPVPFGENQPPGEGERIENRVVASVTPVDGHRVIIVFESTPQVNPDDDPDAPGFDEIQQSREVANRIEQTNQMGQTLVKTAFEVYIEIAKLAAYGPAEGLALEGAVKGVIAAGKFVETAKEIRAGARLLREGAAEARASARALRTLEKSAETEARIARLESKAAHNEELAKQADSMATTGERYAADAAAKFKRDGCFVAGTPVWMGDGTTKAIEQVQVGDTVLSKNEKTGAIAAKKVLHTSVRHDIWTRKLTFDNGAVLETTDEHPLYVDGRGFVKAKEVGIGNSIVTRAGPAAKVVAIQADVRQATVYNFTVDEFHTYFVGQNALWVHNVDCNLGEYSGRPTTVQGDAPTIRSLTRENEAVEPLIGNGYGVHQNPGRLPNGKNPDYFLKGPAGSGVPAEGAYFDCYAPAGNTTTGNVVDTIAKKVNRGQADRIVLNMKDSNLTLSQVENAIRLDLSTPEGGAQLSGLQQILVIDQSGNLIPFFPFK